MRNSPVTVVSHGGLGDLVLHADAVRQYLASGGSHAHRYVAAEPLCALAELLLPRTAWTPLLPAADRPPDAATVTLRWFTTVSGADPAAGAALIADRALYDGFDVARDTGPLALPWFFERGLSMRAIVCRSWGFVEDEDFVRIAPVGAAPALGGEPYVLVANGADRPPPVRKGQTKELPRGLFAACAQQIMTCLPDHRVVEVGRERDGLPVPGVLDLREKTSVLELVDLVAHADAILSPEGGIAHLAAALRKPAVVLTGPTSEAHYGHRLHSYHRSGICRPCAWSTVDWYANCALDIDAACMSAFDPVAVAHSVALSASVRRAGAAAAG